MIDLFFGLLASLIGMLVVMVVLFAVGIFVFAFGCFIGWLLMPFIPLNPVWIGILFVVIGIFLEFRNY